MRLKSGVLLLVALGSLNSCRKSVPPPIPIGIGDGFGGADWLDEQGHSSYKSPSELKGMWMTTQPAMAQFAAWCYNTDVATANKIMEQLKERAVNERPAQ